MEPLCFSRKFTQEKALKSQIPHTCKSSFALQRFKDLYVGLVIYSRVAGYYLLLDFCRGFDKNSLKFSSCSRHPLMSQEMSCLRYNFGTLRCNYASSDSHPSKWSCRLSKRHYVNVIRCRRISKHGQFTRKVFVSQIN